MAIRFKHFGIHVYDLPKMIDFYTNMYGLVVSDYAVEEDINLEVAFMTSSPEDHHQVVLLTGRKPGVVSRDLLNQMSYKADSLDEVLAAFRTATDLGLEDIQPVTHGNAWSCYFRDPEGNRQEVYCDTPWYISQPHFTFMDFTKSPDELRAETEKLVRADPSFRMRSDWQKEISASIAEKLAQRTRA